MTGDEMMEPYLRQAVTEMLANQHAAPGDYAIILHAKVLEDGAVVYDWRWYWAPTVSVRKGKL